VNKGNFRKDLYYRLNVLPISLIPLRERRSDIPLLSMFFMERISKKLNKKAVVINEDAMKSLMDYEWPGNVRELENIIELMVNTEAVPESFLKMHGYAEVKAQGVQGIAEHVIPGQTVPENLDLDFVERQHILKVLELSSGNISQCAKSLGIGRNTLYRKLETFGINCSETEQRSIMKH
jgi:transcriptional regulator with PAS, ATPase and Fis domain